MKPLPLDAALIVIDFQKAIDHPSWVSAITPKGRETLCPC